MTEQAHRPLPESYWVVASRFLAGEYPGRPDEEITRKRLDALIEEGFDLFIDLTQPEEVLPYVRTLREEAESYTTEISYQRFPIGDFGLPSVEQMNLILDLIDRGLQMGHKIYLHCWGGIGRTGTTVGCYLVRRGMTGEEALAQLSAWWKDVPKSRDHPHSPETAEQRKFILGWAAHAADSLRSDS
jgi:hypothetical protein